MQKCISADAIASKLHDGLTIMIGGFMANGAPEGLFDIQLKYNIKNITLITTDTGTPTQDSGRLISAKRIHKVVASHVGTNPETGKQMKAGELEVELVQQGTLAERIRAGQQLVTVFLRG